MAHTKRPTRFSSKSGADFKKRLKAYNKHHKDAKIKASQPAPTEADKRDAQKEAELANVVKNKGKKTKDPGPGVGKDGKKRTATLDEDRKSNEPKKEELKIKGKGPVKSGEEYGKHLKEQSKKYKTTGKGPVKSGKEYGKHLDERKKKKDAKERKDWLDKTRNSPAAKSGFDDNERWALQKRHREWKESRKNRKKNTRTTTKESRKSYATMTKAQRKRARR